MLDRALYMRALHWENEQQEHARQEAENNKGYNKGDEPMKPLRRAPRRKEETVDIPVSEVKKAEEQSYAAIWDGSMEGLKILQPLTMIPPKE